MRILASVVSTAIILFSKFITAVQGFWIDIEPIDAKRVYFANHTSNGDFILIWTVLPKKLRKKTRPVAAADYWLTSKLKSFIGKHVFNAVLIDRNSETRQQDPVTQMVEALDKDESLIIFPEGTRNETDESLLPFKTGIFHLATQRPEVEFVPVWIENLNRVLPKREIIPIPFMCTVAFGAPINLQKGETKDAFLNRAQDAMLALAPANGDQ